MAVRRAITTQEVMRRRCGFSVTELAREIGFSHAYVSRVEGGNLRPSARYRKAVTQALRIPIQIGGGWTDGRSEVAGTRAWPGRGATGPPRRSVRRRLRRRSSRTARRGSVRT
jgi:transcriptional regulator with XRE-family HTH domain